MSNAVRYTRRPKGAKRARKRFVVSTGQFSLAGGFFAMALLAVSTRFPIMLIPALLALPFMFETAWSRGGRLAVWGRLGAIIGAIYVPALKGFSSDCSHCREVWSEMFPLVPGLMPVHFASSLTGAAPPVGGEAMGAAAATVGVFTMALFLLGSSSRVGLLIAVIAGAICSAVSCFVFEGLLRM